jgi:hypothetical protein
MPTYQNIDAMTIEIIMVNIGLFLMSMYLTGDVNDDKIIIIMLMRNGSPNLMTSE